MTNRPSISCRGLLLLAGILGLHAGLAAQEPSSDTANDPHAVYLVTFGPGPQVWERFGHNALWIRDTVTGRGVAYDYGRFNFEQEGFLWRFARGHMEYWMGRADGGALIDAYVRLGRSVVLQELSLDAAERRYLQAALETNFARDSGTYRYDYYRDNCSTRVRDQIDVAVGGALRSYLASTPSTLTLRDHTRRSLDNNLAIYFAAMSFLGPMADRPITALEESFLPALLQEHIRGVQMVDSSGASTPLVRREIQVAESDGYSVPVEVPGRPDRVFGGLGLGLAAVLLVLGLLARNSRLARWGFLALMALWQVFVAVGALLIIWLWGLSDHLAAYRNLNVLHFSVAAVVLLALTPGMMRGDAKRLRAGRTFARLALVASAIGVVLAMLPMLTQSFGDVSGLMFPIHAAVLVGLESLSRPVSSSPS